MQRSNPTTKKIRLAIVGGGFGASFPWSEHPNCVVSAVTDLYAERRRKLRDAYKCDSVYESLEDMLSKRNDLDAVAIFSGAPDHAKHVRMCLEHGLHVVSAVPACQTLEEASQLKELKEKTGLRYMMAESSYYYPGCIYARDLYRQGRFGSIFYIEANYYHDYLEESIPDRRSILYNPDGSPGWRQGLPPMQYPTHTTAFMLAVTGERIARVSCLGWGNPKVMGKLQTNPSRNPFSNEVASMLGERSGMLRCNIFRQIAADGVEARWFGEKASFYMEIAGLNRDVWHERDKEPAPIQLPEYWKSPSLPEAMRHPSGHNGSAVMICAEFINALLDDREPAVDVYLSLAMTAPGIVAHQSALKNGEQLAVPAFERKA